MKAPNLHSHAIGACIKFKNGLLFIVMLFFLSNIYSQQLAFPTAEGFGKYASGGRGGRVIKVTNLNDSGAGSLRAALLTQGARTVVFEVGGTISLESNLFIYDGNITLAGQTAPGDGILIKGGTLQIEDSNVIVRYLRFRPGPSSPSGTDGITVVAWSGTVENIIFDHCSMSWATDENFNLRGSGGANVKNITLQNSIISECGYGVLLYKGTSNITLYGNLIAHNRERNLRSNNPIDGVFGWEMVNNLIYGYREATYPSFGTKFTVLNNKYKESADSPGSYNIVKVTDAGQGTPSETYAFVSGNIIPRSKSIVNLELGPYLETAPFASSGINAVSAESLDDLILNDVGASLPIRDAVDERLITQYHAGTGKLVTSGTYPIMAGGTPPIDSDEDGMPDYWEIENGLNINDASDRNNVQSDGYTNLEYYLNGLFFLGGNDIVADAGEDQNICLGNNTVLTATGGDTYLWNTGETTASITVSPDSSTLYSVTVSNSTNSDTDEVLVTVNPLPITDAGSDITIDLGQNTLLTASGGDSYIWSTGESTQSITVSPVETTIYTVTSFIDGCENSDDVMVTVNFPVIANAGDDIATCEGQDTILTASGGDYYLWSSGETTASITVSPNTTTTYSVIVSNDTNSDTDEVTVVVNSLPAANAGEDITIIDGESTTLTASGGDSYLWSTGENTQSITVSPSETTTYSVTSFSNGCENSDEVIVAVNYPVNANAGDDTIICEGQETILTASGGDYYLWNTGETTNSITVSPNATTTYSVTVSNDTNSDSDEVIVIVNPLPITNAGEDVTINNGENTTLVASGGDSYLWSTGQTTQSINVHPNSTTTYSVTAIENGCEASDEVIVFVETSENVIANAGDDKSICEGETATLSASGGPYFLWSNGETTPSISVSPDVTTTYSVTVSNDHNSAIDEVTVVVNLLPAVHAGDDITITEGESTTLTASGGDSYLWSTGESTASITVNPNTTTTYEVTAFSNGCEATDDIVVTVESAPNVVADAGDDQTICNGMNTVLTASGGDTYLWNTGETSASITVNPNETTTYSVTVSNGITADTDEVTVSVNPLPSVNAGENVTIIEGENATLTATGGDTYLWNTGETSASIIVNPNTTTTYEVTGFGNGCENTDNVVVTVESIPDVEADAGEDETICSGSSVTITATGGDTYLWSTGATSASITVNPNETVTYSVTVSNGITSDSDEVTVYVNSLPVANAGTNVTINEGENTTLTASGGDTYLWNTGATTASINVNPAQTTSYTVTVFSNGCESSDEVTVTVEASADDVLADAGENQYLCQGDQTTLTASGGNSYLWSTGETTRSISVNPTSTTNYTVVVSNGSNSDSDEVTVFVDQKPDVNVSSNKPKILIGEYVTLSATGANEYLWSNGATQPNIAVAPYESTTYNVTGFNNNCSDQKSINVDVLEYVIADAGIDETICFGESLTLTASATGGDAFLWNTGETTKSITVNPDDDTTYSVIVSNELDSHADQVTVFVQNCDVDEEVVLTPDPFVFEVYLNQRSTDDLNVKIAGLTEDTQLFMHDILGKRIYFETLDANGGQEFVKRISLDNISAGVYVITLIENGINKSKKVLLE